MTHALSENAIREIVDNFGDRDAVVTTRYGTAYAAGLVLDDATAILTLTDITGELTDAFWTHDVLDIQPAA